MKKLMLFSTTHHYAYSDSIEEDEFNFSDYFTNISIEITEPELNEDLELINEVKIGIMQVFLYDVDKVINSHEHVRDVADSHNQELSNAILSLFSNNGLKDKHKGWALTDNVLYLERLFIKPAFRGLGYGNFILKNIDRILQRLTSAEFACMVMQPAAFEYSNPEAYRDLLNDNEITNGKKFTEGLYR